MTIIIIDNGTCSCSIFLDLHKPFDAVDWFTMYLSNRRQFVSLFDTNSDYQTIACGVTQDQCLAHFSFFHQQMTCLHNSCILEFHLFADDTNLSLNNPNILNLETHLNVL